MGKVFVTLELSLKPEAIEDFLKQLPDILAVTRQKPGYVSIDVHRQSDMPSTLLMFEQWESAEQYRAYFQWRVDTGFMDALKDVLAAEPRLAIWEEPIMRIEV